MKHVVPLRTPTTSLRIASTHEPPLRRVSESTPALRLLGVHAPAAPAPSIQQDDHISEPTHERDPANDPSPSGPGCFVVEALEPVVTTKALVVALGADLIGAVPLLQPTVHAVAQADRPMLSDSDYIGPGTVSRHGQRVGRVVLRGLATFMLGTVSG